MRGGEGGGRGRSIGFKFVRGGMGGFKEWVDEWMGGWVDGWMGGWVGV